MNEWKTEYENRRIFIFHKKKHFFFVSKDIKENNEMKKN